MPRPLPSCLRWFRSGHLCRCVHTHHTLPISLSLSHSRRQRGRPGVLCPATESSPWSATSLLYTLQVSGWGRDIRGPSAHLPDGPAMSPRKPSAGAAFPADKPSPGLFPGALLTLGHLFPCFMDKGELAAGTCLRLQGSRVAGLGRRPRPCTARHLLPGAERRTVRVWVQEHFLRGRGGR